MKVGLCLYSVKKSLANDPIGTMKKVAEMGFKYWETPCAVPYEVKESPVSRYGLFIPAKEAKKFIDDHGVEITGNHYAPLDYPDFEDYLEFQATLGLTYIGPSAEFYDDYDDVLRKCEILNKQAELAKSYGLKYYFHNHYHEFQKFNGKTVQDIVYENTDPDLVNIQLDTYWAARGGADPVQLINKYKDRLVSLHQKDFPKNTEHALNIFEDKIDPNQRITLDVYVEYKYPETFTEIGTGILDIQSYIDAGNQVGVEFIYLEQDFTSMDELDSVKISMDNFRKYSGIEWD